MILEHRNIDVVVPYVNNHDMTAQCLSAIVRSNVPNVRVILINNGSTSEFPRNRLPEIPVTHCSFPRNQGFTAGVNLGLQHVSEGSDVVILNNDCVLAANTLRSMRQTSYSNGLAIVGPATTDDGAESVCKASVRRACQVDDAIVDAAQQCDLGLLEFHVRQFPTPAKEIQYVPFCCAFIPWECFRRNGLLHRNDGYVSGLWADNEYCRRAGVLGHKSFFDTNSVVVHHGSQTFKSERIDYQKHLRIGQAVYIQEPYPVGAVVVCDRKRWSQTTGLKSLLDNGAKRVYVNIETAFNPDKFREEYADLLALAESLPHVDVDVQKTHSDWMPARPSHDQDQYYRLPRIVAARNQAREWFLGKKNANATHLFFCDSDVEIPPGSLGKLLSLRRPLCGGVIYGRGEHKHVKLVFDEKDAIATDYGDVAECRVFSCGSMLIERQVLERQAFRWGRHLVTDEMLSEDPAFISDSIQNGFGVPYVHLGVVSRHEDNPASPLKIGDVAEF